MYRTICAMLFYCLVRIVLIGLAAAILPQYFHHLQSIRTALEALTAALQG